MITPKGALRRDALLDAVVRVLERGGPGAVTHREVAREAGVPVAAATYYFATIDELLVSALRRATEGQVELFESVTTSDLREFAVALHDWTHVHRASAIAQYELLFLAMRRDSLREAADLWYRCLEDAVESAGPAGRSQVSALAIDGLILRMLWRGDPATVDEIEVALRDIVAT